MSDYVTKEELEERLAQQRHEIVGDLRDEIVPKLETTAETTIREVAGKMDTGDASIGRSGDAGMPEFDLDAELARVADEAPGREA